MEANQDSIYISRRFNCTVHTLFKWLSEPELICQWFGPKHLKVVAVTTDLKIGGAYRIQLLKPDGVIFSIEGVYIEINEPSKLVFSFAYKGMSNTPPDSIVKIILNKVDSNNSNLSLIQSFESTPKDLYNRTKAWEIMFKRLKGKLVVSNKG